MIATCVVERQYRHRIRLTVYSDPLGIPLYGVSTPQVDTLFCAETFRFLQRNADSLLSDKLSLLTWVSQTRKLYDVVYT